ncbi:MAG: D-alanine--D-alanine ligase family protein [Promethearchaeota archaeon]
MNTKNEKGKIKICLLEKKRGNFSIHEKFAKNEKIIDTTDKEVEHHFKALKDAGYDVVKLKWNDNIISELKNLDVDLVFNVSSLIESAILDELEIPYVGADLFGCVIATDKALAKDLWIKNGLPTSPYVLANSIKDCEIFKKSKPFDYPLFIKPSKGRGSSGIDDSSLIRSYNDLVKGVKKRLDTINQPVLIERFLEGREITCGVIGNGSRIRSLPLLEVAHEGDDIFLTFDKKELDDDLFRCPAQLTSDQTNKIQQLAISAYKTIGIRDYGRVDTILTEEGPFLLEINSFAGLMCTPIEKPHSYMGFMALAENMNGSELLDGIVKEALIRIGKSL